MIPFLGPTDPFPPVDQALDQPDGLLAAGGTLTMKRLIDAYTLGIFPWFNDGDPVLWWSPDPRTVLAPSRLHISHSLKKRLKKNGFLVTIDAAFARVLDGCAAPRAEDSGTWLTPQMRRAYTSLHVAGLAHSIEVWMDGELAGGIYGVALGRMFFGESMFSRRTDASKIAMARLAQQLDRWGFPLIDCQLETDHLLSLGAEHMPRRAFVREVDRLVKEPEPSWHLDEDLRGSAEHLPRIIANR
jgi:leucyl/phenylalanyl-tRNA---protein transferase